MLLDELYNLVAGEQLRPARLICPDISSSVCLSLFFCVSLSTDRSVRLCVRVCVCEAEGEQDNGGDQVAMKPE